jgi:chaperonin GroES
MQPIDTNKLQKFINSKNIADLLDDETLTKISTELEEGIAFDKNSRAEWVNQMKEALALARQDLTRKDFPWDGASNDKIPLILSACIQFNARIVPELIQGNKIVEVAVMRDDEDKEHLERAYHQGRHMSYQLIDVIDNWIPDTDRLMMSLPLLGTVYRKTYFDPIDKIPCVDLCLPDDVIVNQSCSSLKKAERVTHMLALSTNQLIERMRSGIYKNYSLDELPEGKPPDHEDYDSENISTGHNVSRHNDPIHEISESHCWFDLDGDDYREPYIVTRHTNSGKILRIKARYDNSSWKTEDNKVIGIEGNQYFTAYHFMPSPDGAFMGLGFGQILYPTNESINTLVNQLIDAGTLNNMQSGFISRALKIKKERLRFSPGEWHQVNAPSGIALTQAIMALPTKEPSQTLFSLLEFLLQSGRELSAINEPMQGQLPPANTPATTVLAVLKQGQKQYSSVYRRVLYSLRKEFEKLYDLNSKYLKNTEDYRLARESGMVKRNQYDKKVYGVFPVADPNISSDQERLTKLQALWNVKDDPNINAREVVTRYVEMLRLPDSHKILNPPPNPNAPPPPDVQLELAKAHNLDAQSKKIQFEMMIDADHKAEQLHLAEKELELKMLQAEDAATEARIASISQLAQTDLEVGDKEMLLAERKQALIERRVALDYAQLQQQPITGGATQPIQTGGQMARQQVGGAPAGMGMPTAGMPGQEIPQAAQAPAQEQPVNLAELKQQTQQET